MLSWHLIFCPALSYRIPSYCVVSNIVLSCPVLSNPILSYPILSCPVLSYQGVAEAEAESEGLLDKLYFAELAISPIRVQVSLTSRRCGTNFTPTTAGSHCNQNPDN